MPQVYDIHWVEYQNPEPFVWFVLINQFPHIHLQHLYRIPSERGCRFRNIGADFQNLLKSKQAEQKVMDFGIPPSV